MAWRVLAVDDDPEIGILIKTILRSPTFEVTICSSAESALVQFKRDSGYDILISDFMLPGLSGIDLVTMVRADLAKAKIPILMMSGHGNYKLEARAKDAGADHFLHKPFTPSHLRTIVTTLASKYRPLPPNDEPPTALR